MTKLIVSFKFLLTLEVGQIKQKGFDGLQEMIKKNNAFQAATEDYSDRNKVVAILTAILYFSKILDFH